MDVLFLAPAYPVEMRRFTKGFAEVGARVWGVGDSPVSSLPADVRDCLAGYLQVPRIMDENDVIQRVEAWLGSRRPDRIESLWEPLVLLAARLRDRLGVPGMSHDTVLGFRDKQLMKERLRKAGLRVPHSRRVLQPSDAWAAAEEIGYPLILKPIAGAGSADTYRVDNAEQMADVLKKMGHVREASCEEFVEGEEFTYDTVCIDGVPAYENVAQYLPRPLLARTNEWISPVIITVRDLHQPKIRAGIELGRKVLKALGMGTGFTHMEWYLKANGEVVFGEIGCRPGGAHLVDQMNFTSDISLYRECARAICWKSFEADATRKFNTAIVFKRAQGKGTIRAITGLEAWKQRAGRWVAAEELLPVGARRRDWLQTLVSDGFVIVRHPDWDTAYKLAFDAANHIQMFAS